MESTDLKAGLKIAGVIGGVYILRSIFRKSEDWKLSECSISARFGRVHTPHTKGKKKGGHKQEKTVEIVIKIPGSSTTPRKWMLNFYGSGIPYLGKIFLPLKQGNYLRISPHITNENPSVTDGNLPVTDENSPDSNDAMCQSYRLGVGPEFKSTYRDTVLVQLEKMANHRDSIIIMEVLNGNRASLNPESVIRVAFRPSSLLRALKEATEEPVQVMCINGDREGVSRAFAHRPKPMTLLSSVSRLFCFPTCGLGAVWLLITPYKTALLQKLPKIVIPGINWAAAKQTLGLAVHALPKNTLEAFDIGVLVANLEASTRPTAEILEAAGSILKRAVTIDELVDIRNELAKFVAKKSLTQRIIGAFSFVNLIWGVSLLGILSTCLPVLVIILEWLRPYIVRVLKVFEKAAVIVKRLLIWVIENLVVPFIVRCHSYGVFEAIGHAGVVVLHGYAIETGGYGAGGMLCLTAIASYCMACLYSLSVQQDKYEAAFETACRKYPQLTNAAVRSMPFVAASYVIPLAVCHHSTLLAYVATASALAGFGFGVAVRPFCYIIGWQDDDAMARTAVACGLGVAGFVIIRTTCSIEPHALQPFVGPVSVLGGIGHYLALLIQSSRFYTGLTYSKDSSYWHRNAVMLVSLAAGTGVGYVYGMSGLANTATTFGVLWVLEKYADLEFFGMPAVLTVFTGSVGLYYTAMWLHANPEFIISMSQLLK